VEVSCKHALSPTHLTSIPGFSNCLFTFFGDVSGRNGELFTAVHSLFSFFRGIAILSVGPVGAAILLRSPDIELESYAIGKYKVRGF
jgi:hypothetical protein